NPKVVCSTTKASINIRLGEMTGSNFVPATMFEVHKRKMNPLIQPRTLRPAQLTWLLNAKRVIRFAFVRDPVSRFVSAFADKIALGSNGPTSHRVELFGHLGLDVEASVSAEDLADIFREDKVARDMNRHWWLQRHGIAFDLIDYTFIGHQKSWDADFATVSARIFGEALPVFDTRTRFGHATVSHKRKLSDPARLEGLIAEAYADDYAMLAEIEQRGLNAPKDWPKPVKRERSEAPPKKRRRRAAQAQQPTETSADKTAASAT
ncbi:MAG: sulfotransferase family 2 domain-containing protein, partial [Pseudomonadota bacterium]